MMAPPTGSPPCFADAAFRAEPLLVRMASTLQKRTLLRYPGLTRSIGQYEVCSKGTVTESTEPF